MLRKHRAQTGGSQLADLHPKQMFILEPLLRHPHKLQELWSTGSVPLYCLLDIFPPSPSLCLYSFWVCAEYLSTASSPGHLRPSQTPNSLFC